MKGRHKALTTGRENIEQREPQEVIVMVHGYGQTVGAGQREWHPVAFDRLRKALQVAQRLKSLGNKVKIIISGGTVTNNVNEADAMFMLAEDELPQLLEFGIILEKNAKNTAENAALVLPRAKGSLVFPVSSKDHAPRLEREWAAAAASYPGTIVAVVASDECYSERGEQGVQTFIAEPPFWATDVLSPIFKVPATHRDRVAKEIARVIDEALPHALIK